MTEIIPIKFDDPTQRSNILNLLGGVYNDPRDALKEYVANSLDANASNIVVDLSSRKKGVIQVRDDGSGMDRDKLRSVPDSVALSDKLLMETAIGEKAIGILAFYSLGAECLVLWSKAASVPGETHCLRFRRGDLNPVLDPDDESKEHPWLRANSGTVVELRSIPPEIARLLTLEKVRDHLARLYREILRRRPMRLVVVEGKQSEYVKVDSFKGTPFWMRDLVTKYGRIELQLYVLPSQSDRRVEVSCKGQRVSEVGGLDERFEVSPWSTGQIHGVVSADFLKPTTGRTGFATNAAFSAFVDKLDSLRSELQKAVDLEVETYKKEQDREMQRELNNSFLRALLALKGRGWSGAEVLVRSRTGEAKGTAVESALGVRVERKGRRKQRRGLRQQVLEDGEESATRGAGFNIDPQVFKAEDAHLRSKFDSRQALVLINQIHPDYREEYANQRRRYEYFHLLIAKELTLYNWGKEKPDSMLEHLVELEVVAKRYGVARNLG